MWHAQQRLYPWSTPPMSLPRSDYDPRRVCLNPFPDLNLNLGKHRRTIGIYLAGALVCALPLKNTLDANCMLLRSSHLQTGHSWMLQSYLHMPTHPTRIPKSRLPCMCSSLIGCLASARSSACSLSTWLTRIGLEGTTMVTRQLCGGHVFSCLLGLLWWLADWLGAW